MPLHEEDLRYLLALNRIPGVGSAKLINFKDSNREQFLKQLIEKKGLDRDSIEKAVEKDLAFAASPDCHIVTLWDEDYPVLLKEIPNKPALLFVRGDKGYLKRPQIAIVGSRNPSPMGLITAQNFAQHFASLGFTVTSGLAMGIDTAGHEGAVKEAAGTIAVLGNGLDTIYPASNQQLAKEIVKNGALVSEFPIGVAAVSAHFPRRNRVISGLSLGTLVVEAAVKSGSLITAKFALDQGREVFAIPGSIHSPLAKGCHALIRQGAKLVEKAEDVLEELSGLLQLMNKEVMSTEIKASLDFPLCSQKKPRKLKFCKHSYSTQHELLLAKMGFAEISIDSLVKQSGLTAEEVSIMLLELELSGAIKAVPGGFMRIAAMERNERVNEE